MNRRPHRGFAFTLVEVLVVITLISLLISILVPSMQKSRDAARNTQCQARLKAIGVASMLYANVYGRFPDLNNAEDDGTWQYNYLIFDGEDFDQNFGPLVRDRGEIAYIKQLYCPVQKDPYHLLATPFNPWPVAPPSDTRSSYGRRYRLSGKTLSQLKGTKGLVADVIHLPKVVKSAHKNGVNSVYTDGHVQWVRDPGILTDNELVHPFDVEDNEIIEDIWDVIDGAL